MSATKVKYGKPATLLVDAKGFPDGRLVQFEIEKQTGQKKEKITEVNGVVRREKGVGQWEPPFKRAAFLPLKEKLSQQPTKEQYSFTAIIDKGEKDEKKTQGTPIEFSFPIDVYLKDQSGNPIDGVECTIIFSDGTNKKGTFRNGHAKFDEAPPGKFEIKLEDFEFMF